MSKNELKNKRKRLLDEIDLVGGMWKQQRAYIEARENLTRVEVACRKKLQPRIDELRKQVAEIDAQLKVTKKAPKPKVATVVPEKLKDILARALNGTNWGAGGLIVDWTSKSERFAIVRNPGHSYVSGRRSVYAQTTHHLLDLNLSRGGIGAIALYECQYVPPFRGRLDKHKRETWKRLAELAEPN